MKKILALLFSLVISPVYAGVPCSLPFNLQNNTTADATQVMANYNALVTCLTNAAAAGINSDITALTALTTPITPSQGGSTVYVGATGGVANAQTMAVTTPSGFILTNGLQVLFKAGFANTGAMTLNVGSTGAIPVLIQAPSGAQALIGGEVQNGQWNNAVYNSADNSFYLRGIPTLLGAVGPTTSVLSATTTDLSLAVNHNASITGTTTITSFGSNANVNFPLYNLAFTGSLTLTYNAASLVLPGTVNIQTAAGDTAVAAYLGSGNWQIISYQHANGTGPTNQTPPCGFNGLVVKNNAGTPNTNVDVTANSAAMNNGTASNYRTSVSFTINLTTGTVTSTANGMDGEARPTSGWVYLYMIDNGTAAAGLGSSSSTSPTLPTGYSFSCYMGAMRADGSSNLMRSIQKGRHAQYAVTAATNTTAPPNIANGSAGTWSASAPVYAAVSVSTVVPTTATAIYVIATCTWNGNGAADASVAPNTAYGGSGSTSPPPFTCGVVAASGEFLMLLESSNIAWASTGAGGGISALGWEDAVNAN